MVKAEKRPFGGRPRQSAEGLREQVGVRVSPQIKRLLEGEAKKNRRSVTAEVEARLAHSLGMGREVHVHGLMVAVGKLAGALERRFQRRWTHDAFTTQALRVGVDQVLFHFGLFGEPVLPPAIKTAVTKMPTAEKETFSTPEGWGKFEAGALITAIENAVSPLPGAKPEFGPTGWGHYELLRALGSGWKRNRAAWLPERKGDVS
jgi:TraY domain